MNNNLWSEVIRLVEEYEASRPSTSNESRLYYREDGTIIGLWKTDYPNSENFIILDDTDLFYKANSLLLRVQNGKLVLLDPLKPAKTRLKKSKTGFRVVKGNAALILEQGEEFFEIEYYDQANN